MKVCVVGLRGFPGVIGGVETHCEQLYTRLAAANPDIDITVIARSPYIPTACVHKGVRVTPVWTVRNKYLEAILHTFLAVLYARFAVKADVIHIHAIGPALFTPLARALGLSVVVTHHGEDYKRAKWNRFARKALRLGERLAIRFADQVAVVGETLTGRLKTTYPRMAGKIHHIPNGATLPASGPTPNDESVLDELGLKAGGYVLAVGRLVPEKGFGDLIDAHRLAGVDAKLVIVGDTTHKDRYAAQLLTRRSDNVVFAGYRTGGELRTLYANAERFVLPSHHEGLPISALEAMSAGAPVLLSDIGPNRDVGLPADFYFPVGDRGELAQRLRQPVERLGFGVYEELMKRFSWDGIVARTLALYFPVHTDANDPTVPQAPTRAPVQEAA